MDMYSYVIKDNYLTGPVTKTKINPNLFLVGTQPSPEDGKDICEKVWKKCLDLKEVHVCNRHTEEHACWMRTFHFSKEELEKELKEKGHIL